MTDEWLAALRARGKDIADRLERADAQGDREALKRDIIAYFKQVDGALVELADIKESIRGLVDRYKQIVGEPDPVQSPHFSGDRPAIRADHLGASTYIDKGWNLIALGDHDGAIQALSKALRLVPEDTQAQSLLGWAQMLSESYDDALATFSRVLSKEPANSLARINVGFICLKKGIFGEAIEHLSKAIRLDNDRKATLYAHYYLGLVYLERQMYDDAVTFFRKTLALGPNLIEAHYQLGRALWFADDQEAAVATWETGVTTNRFNSWGKRCQDMLDLVRAGGDVPRTPPS